MEPVDFPLPPDRFGITKQRVRDAMRRFDRDFRGHESETGTGYFVQDGKKRYPPKRLLALTIGRTSTRGFSGGEQTNSVFKKLGFKVRPISEVVKQLERERRAALRKSVPRAEEVVRGLFSQRWRALNGEVLADFSLRWPGVYVLAWSPKEDDLDGVRVAPGKVLYIGMSNYASLARRLRQFVDSLRRRGGHSAGVWLCAHPNWHRAPLAVTRRVGGSFYFACAAVPCVTRKGKRKTADLKKIGVIAAAEQFALAHVLNKAKKEPPLNRQ